MARDDAREVKLLDQYLDRAPGGRQQGFDDLDNTLRRTIERLEASDDVSDPDPGFVDRLWSELAGEASTAPVQSQSRTQTDKSTPEVNPNETDVSRPGLAFDLRSNEPPKEKRPIRQLAEMLAAAVILVAVVGALVFAYQNLLGGGDDAVPGSGPGEGTPRLSTAGVIPQFGDILDNGELGPVEIVRHDGESYALMLVFPASDDPGAELVPSLKVVRLDAGGEHELVATLVSDIPWSGPMQFNMGASALVDRALYLPVPTQERPGLWVVDVSDPTDPAEVAYLAIEDDWLMTVVASGNTLVGTGIFGNILFFVDISDREDPSVVSQLDAGDLEFYSSAETPSLQLDGDRLYVTHPRGVTILDISDSSAPVEIGHIENPDWEGPQTVTGGQPPKSILDRVVRPDAWHDTLVVDRHAYVATGEHGLLIYEVSDAGEPVEVDALPREDRTFSLGRLDDHGFALGVSEPDNGTDLDWVWSLDALDVSDPGAQQVFDRLTVLNPHPEAGDTAHGFVISMIRNLSVSEEFLVASGRGGAFVAHIEWLDEETEAVER